VGDEPAATNEKKAAADDPYPSAEMEIISSLEAGECSPGKVVRDVATPLSQSNFFRDKGGEGNIVFGVGGGRGSNN
jgi:hypothetical protein